MKRKLQLLTGIVFQKVESMLQISSGCYILFC